RVRQRRSARYRRLAGQHDRGPGRDPRRVHRGRLAVRPADRRDPGVTDRVEMRSPAGAGTALVPARQVERMKPLGWRSLEAKKAPDQPTMAPARKSAKNSAASDG